jgi:hypothetical protein
MKVFVVGATGATGRWVVKKLLGKGSEVRVVVRSRERFDELIAAHPALEVVEASIGEMSAETLAPMVKDCSAIVSCLGHNLNFKGIWGKPRNLITRATEMLCAAVTLNKPAEPVSFLLMNTVGVANMDLVEPRGFVTKVAFGILRNLIPPQLDNETAAEFLRSQVGKQHAHISWVVVRPDTLVDEAESTEFVVHPSPTRDPLFNPGKTSRANVAEFMVQLLLDPILFEKWKGQMPAIYNKSNRSG